jgi:predicted branched-subunit amino acid permease
MKMFLGIVKYVEWVLGTVMFTAIGTILSLKDVKGCGGIVLIVALYIFLIVTTIKWVDEHGWIKSRGESNPKE